MGGSNTSEGVQILQYMPEVFGPEGPLPGGVQFFRDNTSDCTAAANGERL